VKPIAGLMNKYINKYKSLFKFGIVGVTNTIIDYVTFVILNAIGINYILCQIAAYSVGTLNSYIFNKNWTFKGNGNNKKPHEEFMEFLIINIITLIITELSLIVLLKEYKLNIYIAKVCIVILAQAANYFSYKLWVFAK
jgi:putative flippase GtrA